MTLPRDPLSGFELYRHLTISPICNNSGGEANAGHRTNGRPGALYGRDHLPTQEIFSISGKITHVSLWVKPDDRGGDSDSGDVALVAIAITAAGTVHAWKIKDSPEEGKLHPFAHWLRLHLLSPSKTSQFATPPRVLGRPFSPELWSPTTEFVTWFGCYANLRVCRRHSQESWCSRIAWISAGHDGMVFGRSLPTTSSRLEGACDKAAGAGWALNLAAHKPAEVTDVDVDPHGRWIATVSTDCSVRVWCLATKEKIFEDLHQPTGLRCVRFSPVTVDLGNLGTEMLLALGDLRGKLQVWRLTAPKGFENRHLAVAGHATSEAAGCGGCGFCSLIWSADGTTLAGLSDRLCVWRIIQMPSPTCCTSRQQNLGRPRVVRVFDTTSQRNRLFVSKSPQPDTPPTLVAMEALSGTCFVFDPVEMFGGRGSISGDNEEVFSDLASSLLNKSKW